MYYWQLFCVSVSVTFFPRQASRFWGSVSHSGQSFNQAAHISVPGLASGGSSPSKTDYNCFF